MSVNPALGAFQLIKTIECAYLSVMLDPRIPASASFAASVTDKLHNTTCLVAYARLANGIVQINHHRTTTSSSSSLDATSASGGFKQALRLHILTPTDRFAQPSRDLRKLLKDICAHASESSVSLVEGFWREVIAEMVLEKCTQAQTPTQTQTQVGRPRVSRRLDASTHGPQHHPQHPQQQRAETHSDSDGLVDRLIATLSEVRYISRMDMAVTNMCCMSADLAFVMAFRRLPKEKSLELTKALVVRISTLIDSFKTLSMSRSWAQAVDNVTDLIQVKENFAELRC